MLPDLFIQHAVPYSLVLTRIGGVFIAAPMLAGAAIPHRVKTLLAMMMSAAVYPGVSQHLAQIPDYQVVTLLPMFIAELAIGFVMGLLVSVPMMALEMAGSLIGQQMGFGLAKVYNPEVDLESDILGRLLFYLAFGAFLAIGGLESMFSILARSFENVPVGVWTPDHAPVQMLTRTLSTGVELAMRTSAPTMGVVLLLLIAFGVIGKTMPQINVMSEGFAVKIIGGLAVLAGSLYAVDAAAGTELERVLVLLNDWVAGLGGG